MKYAVWFVRLLFASWMIPAGLNHFVPLFPQPLGSQPLSQELFLALFDSHLFDLVKAVELVAGIGALTGLYLPLTLVICMPVSFCVWYWDTPLEGWGSIASYYGGSVLLANVLLCLAYVPTYRGSFALRSKPRPLSAASAGPSGERLILAARLIFGAWMLANGISYFFASIHPMPAGHAPLAMQLMTALDHSSLLDVVMGIQLVTGALILAGIFVPLALCVVMPISVCAAFWGVILEHRPLAAVLALAAIALNGLLMLAYIDYYKGILQRRALAVGETVRTNFDALYMNPGERTSRGDFIGALVPLLAVFALYYFVVTSRNGQWCQVMLIYPAIALHARRLHDMGRSAWPLLVPAALLVATAWLHLYVPGARAIDVVTVAAAVVSAGFIVWGLIGKGQADDNRFGKAAALGGGRLERSRGAAFGSRPPQEEETASGKV
jgi:uncharacterized membrane protein YhaH (DUF805 family)